MLETIYNGTWLYSTPIVLAFAAWGIWSALFGSDK